MLRVVSICFYNDCRVHRNFRFWIMENESTSTWALLNKSGEIESIESDPGSSSESSIEFIHDEIVHYERNNNQRSSLQPEVQKDSQDVSENSSEVWSFHDSIFDGATVADHGSAMKDENGERSRRDLTLENITSANSNASVSPYSKSPVSPSSSDDSSGSVTLLEGRFSDGDSDFELLDQHSSSDLAHLQLATGANNALPANQRPKINFKYKKQALGKSLTESANANDADDESSNNVEQCSSAEESEVALTAPDDTISPVTNLGSLASSPSHLLVPSLLLKPPRMSITFMMLASLIVGLLLGFTTKHSLGPYSSEQLSEDIAEMQRINEMHLLIEENEHMRKYVDSLKWRMNNLQNSKKQQLSTELRQVNQLLKNRLDELDQQLLAVRNEIFDKKSGVQPPVVSNSRNEDRPTDVPQDLNEPASDSDPESQTEISSSVGAAFHDDIIQIQSSPEENVDKQFRKKKQRKQKNRLHTVLYWTKTAVLVWIGLIGMPCYS
ncbi:EPS15 [Acanthosepion pharaonis]|uniref:EPS15 n=1 Tax=Acanthosepion pharaonis TaxID=158019 RepID=A0A812D816_ACAPH|nr:EPS15 [Sepia pharaonis]